MSKHPIAFVRAGALLKMIAQAVITALLCVFNVIVGVVLIIDKLRA